MSATDELRRMLDERGMEWSSSSGMSSSFADRMTFIGDIAVVSEIDGSDLLRINFDGTPEQAIAATLGRGKCKIINNECSSCHTVFNNFENMTWQKTDDGYRVSMRSPIQYCPNCGREVER